MKVSCDKLEQQCDTIEAFPLRPRTKMIVYTQIQVIVMDRLQVTFDDNKNNNFWSFHEALYVPNVSGIIL